MPHKRARATHREGTFLASLAALETDLEAAWNEHHGAKPREWEQYAFDTRERAKALRRTREWTAVAQSELEVVREMARCLRLIGEGKVPR